MELLKSNIKPMCFKYWVAAFNPLWSLGLLKDIGGFVLFANHCCSNKEETAQEYFIRIFTK